MKQDDEDPAIHTLIQDMSDAWNRCDAKALGERFAEDGGFTNVLGTVVYGWESFRQRHAELFAGVFKGTTAKQTVRKLRFIRPDVAIADIDAEVSGYTKSLPGIEAPADGVIRSRCQLVFVKDDGQWWITSFHNVDLKPLPARN